jgi:hemerythrin-like domain-containing protein
MATTSRSRKSGDDDVLSMLEQDHKKVQKLFKEFEKKHRDEPERARAIVEEACTDLEVHAALEEELFYPAVRDAMEDEEDKELIAEALIEHDSAKQLIAQLREMDAGDERYAATFTVLGEYVNHHIEEEQNEMFKRVRKLDLDLSELAQEMKERRQQMLEMLQGESPESAENSEAMSEELETGAGGEEAQAQRRGERRAGRGAAR